MVGSNLTAFSVLGLHIVSKDKFNKNTKVMDRGVGMWGCGAIKIIMWSISEKNYTFLPTLDLRS